MIEGFEAYLAELVPERWRWAASAGAIAAGTLVAAVVARFLIGRVFARLARRTPTELDDRLIGLLRPAIFWTVVVAGGLLLRVPVEPPAWLDLVWLRVGQTLLVALWLVFGLRAAGAVLEALARGARGEGLLGPRTRPLFEIAAKVFLAGAGVYLFLLVWNIDISAWVASAGILGIALGLGAQETLANLFAGLSILADAPYKVGDFIVLDSGERGQVTVIGMRSTRILTRDDVEVTIPNSVIARAKIVNESGGPAPRFRARVPIGVAYGSDLDAVRRALLAVAAANEGVCREPEPRVRFRAFGASSLDLELLVWVDDPALRGQVLDELNTAIYDRFAADGIRIPFPQRDVHLYQPEPER